MFKKLRTRFQERLEVGFWFPLFQKLINLAYENLSGLQYLNRWFIKSDKILPGVAEPYQLIYVILGIIWASFINNPLYPFFATYPWQFLGCFVALHRVSDIFFFSLHWTFVATNNLVAVRRSLAGFLVNLFEVALYFSIFFNLAACQKNPMTGWQAVYENLYSVFKLELVAVRETTGCNLAAHYEIIIAATLLMIIIASLVGTVVREEESK